jgi:GNAT superfamily N-acetyltransferase
LSEKINFNTPLLTGVSHSIDHKCLSLLQKYDTDIKAVINLCGGIPTASIKTYNLTIHHTSNTTIQCTVTTNLFNAVRRINFGLRVIFNDFLEINKEIQGNGVGTRLLCNQVKEARIRNFRRLDVSAMGPDGSDTNWQGYYTWGRLGFEMDTADHEDLMAMLQRLKRKETCLWELLLHTDGQNLWRRDGFTWHGSFYLHDDSQSLKWLRKYLKEKEKEYEI